MYKHCCSNLDVLYAKGLLTQDYKDNKVLLKKKQLQNDHWKEIQLYLKYQIGEHFNTR